MAPQELHRFHEVPPQPPSPIRSHLHSQNRPPHLHLHRIPRPGLQSLNPTRPHLRQPPITTGRGPKQNTISAANYGPTWRLLRRNLVTETLHPARVKSFSQSRKRVLQDLINKLKIESKSRDDHAVRVVDHFRHATLGSLLSMCFGENIVNDQEEDVIKNVDKMMRDALVSSSSRFSVLVFFPRLSKTLFPNMWAKLEEAKTSREIVLGPLIKSRALENNNNNNYNNNGNVACYVDSLLNLSIPEEGGRKLGESEIIGLCSEFLNAGADSTATALQWIMANLVKHQDVQDKVFEEIKRVVRDDEEGIIREEDLEKMTYLKAVVLEGLRRHPPVHVPIPHAVTDDVTLEGHLVPTDASVVFLIAEMGWDPAVWDRPMEFDPGRFVDGGMGGVDISGNRGIKMMPFGAGRRICPGVALSMLHLEYFVANLVWEFKWTAREREEVDLEEKQEFTVTMKCPLYARLSPR
ncbi:hypothetical protein Sjap_002978 [Stephania japonica]|uniref:Cytochrome P450 n=1 Tax=Stephania japonica TaxID=461633 RepID=A0AAP0PT24_9MAGN